MPFPVTGPAGVLSCSLLGQKLHDPGGRAEDVQRV